MLRRGARERAVARAPQWMRLASGLRNKGRAEGLAIPSAFEKGRGARKIKKTGNLPSSLEPIICGASFTYSPLQF